MTDASSESGSVLRSAVPPRRCLAEAAGSKRKRERERIRALFWNWEDLPCTSSRSKSTHRRECRGRTGGSEFTRSRTQTCGGERISREATPRRADEAWKRKKTSLPKQQQTNKAAAMTNRSSNRIKVAVLGGPRAGKSGEFTDFSFVLFICDSRSERTVCFSFRCARCPDLFSELPRRLVVVSRPFFFFLPGGGCLTVCRKSA